MIEPSTHKRLLVVIPALNESEFIERTVTDLALQAERFPGSQVVVADGGSTDDTVAKAASLVRRFPNLTVINNPKRLQAAAVNLAASKFGEHADVLVRCDAHASYPSNYLSALVSALEQTQADTIVVSMNSSGTGCVQKAIAWISDTPVGSGGSAHRAGSVSGFVDHGHHAAFRMQCFNQIGGYNESFAYNEDAEMDCRFRAAGSRIYLDASISITYYPRSSFASLSKQYSRYGRGRAGTFIRHPSSLRARQILVPLNTVACALALVVAVYVHWALLLPAAYFAVLMIYSIKIALHRQSLCGLGAGVAGFVMHQSWAFGFLRGLALESSRLMRERAIGGNATSRG